MYVKCWLGHFGKLDAQPEGWPAPIKQKKKKNETQKGKQIQIGSLIRSKAFIYYKVYITIS